MDAVNVSRLGKKFIISHEKEALIRSILPSMFRPSRKEELWALRDITFRLKKGESLGLIGPNGAGKSVLLNILSGITAMTCGSFKLSGKVSTILTLGAGFHHELTGEENIFLNATILGMTLKEIRQKFDSIVDFCGLDGFIDAPIQTYSMGMLLRLGFSIAVHVDFDILLVDEVIGVGDLQFREKSLNKLKEFRNQGKTVVLASQSLDLIKEITDKTIYLRNGIVEGFGDSENIVKIYEKSAKSSNFILMDKSNVLNLIERKKEEQSPDKVKASWGLRSGGKIAEITSVKLLNKDKKECVEFNSGELLQVQVRYKVKKEISEPHFGVAIFRKDQVYCYGPNTKFDGLLIKKMTSGNNDFSIYYPSLLLSPGTYFISIAIWEREEVYAHDYHCAYYKLVIKGEGAEDLFLQPYECKTEVVALNGRVSYEIELEAVDKRNKKQEVFGTGDLFKIMGSLSYDRKTSDFFVKIYRKGDNVSCFSMRKPLKSHLRGKTSAKIHFIIPELKLLTGNYNIIAELRDRKGSVLARKDKTEFFVYSKRQDHGLVYLHHEWDLGEITYEIIK
ncbi:MAG: ABC transporter ATP-binding protein [Candidatus Omnitrophica bacterium]|nr:ABC transporter ATP-binding protein [Candidatus Omnitrophota bacterium]